MTYSGGSFEPIETGSPLQNIQQNFQSFEVGLQPVQEQAEMDLRRKTELDIHKYDDLIAFTDKLKPFIEERARNYIQKKQAVDMNQEFANWAEQTKSDPQSPLIQQKLRDLAAKENRAYSQEGDIQRVMNSISKQDSFASREFQKLSPYTQNALIVQHTQQQSLVHANTMPLNRMKAESNPVAAQRILTEHRTKTFGNIGQIFPNADKGFLYKYVYEPIRQRESQALSAW